MKCDLCDKEAIVHLTQKVDGVTKQFHFCEDHAREKGLDINAPVAITDMLMGLGQQEKMNLESNITLSCPRCGMAREEFRKSGRLGCPDCYQTFMAELVAAAKAMHHSTQHVGKIPQREGADTRIKSQIARLQKELQDAISREAYEVAATLRDEIKLLEAQFAPKEGAS